MKQLVLAAPLILLLTACATPSAFETASYSLNSGLSPAWANVQAVDFEGDVSLEEAGDADY